MRTFALALLVVCSACRASVGEALAKKDWAAARDAAHDEGGGSSGLLHAWARNQAELTLAVHAVESPIPTAPADSPVPIRIHASGKLSMRTLLPHGHYETSLRAGGLHWTQIFVESSEYRTDAVVDRLLGSGRTWAPYDQRVLLDALYSNHPFHPQDQDHKDVFDVDVVLLPSRPGLGPDALFVDALADWPDAKSDPEDALHWVLLEFAVVPLPPGGKLVDRINALPASMTLHPAPIETHQLLGM
jgi:hypothetical protein